MGGAGQGLRVLCSIKIEASLGAKSGTGAFVFTAAGLQVGKKYTMCAYARSNQETVYGDVVDFVSK
jgi:hypothetical protein